MIQLGSPVFFKKKTAYDLYQCDWSSDVCSSDLVGAVALSHGDLPSGAFIQATFQNIGDLIVNTMAQKITPDDRGRFVVCGTPRDRKVQLTLRSPNGVLADTAVIVPRDVFSYRMLWVVTPRP